MFAGSALGVKGALIGTGVGAVGGALLALAAEAYAGANEPSAPLYGAAIGGVMGALPGAGGRAVAIRSTIGFFGGAVIGGVVGAIARPRDIDFAEEDAVLLGAGFFGLIGYGVGTLVSYTVSKWQEVPLDRLRVSLAPQRDGRLGLGLSVSFWRP
ncbi:MAG: hypothetical protein JSW71_02610 [Gemmatimonadota bacterium]|nr:MAG: hypothetical protein JSW71_02610 [Gemmatimonadota bacterium]